MFAADALVAAEATERQYMARYLRRHPGHIVLVQNAAV
jgi:hypothetical protein